MSMTCEQAAPLISARIDGELTGGAGWVEGSSVALDAHLAECDTCRMTLSEMEAEDAALMRAFTPRVQTAQAIAERVLQLISLEKPTRKHANAGQRGWHMRLRRTAGWAAAAAAGFLGAVIFMRPARPRPVVPVAQFNAPVARLTLATGDVFACPAGEHAWQPLSPGGAIDSMTTVRTADAKCELTLADGSCVRLNSRTEARFTGSPTVTVSAGEVWSAIGRNAAPVCVAAGATRVTARGMGSDKGAEFDVARTPDAATVTVQRGTVDVAGNGPPATVHAGQVLRAPPAVACSVTRDWPSSWQDDLLVLKPGDDPEVAARVEELLRSISTRSSETPGPAEQDVRARGEAWCTPFACYVRRPQSGGENHRIAARLLADLAPPARIADLISLLDDADGQVRYHAAVALRRLTGQTLGYPPEQCATSRDPAAAIAWRRWWENSRLRYSSATALGIAKPRAASGNVPSKDAIAK